MGVEQIVFHVETERHLDYRLNQIHEAGIRAGVALKPATPLSTLDYVLEKCDAVLLMLINPGYAQCRAEGQVPHAARKIRALREMISSRGLQTKIILDGRISKENLQLFECRWNGRQFVSWAAPASKRNDWQRAHGNCCNTAGHCWRDGHETGRIRKDGGACAGRAG
ncbi:MAG: hypothetical protein ACLUFI_15295 [Oscillospiraceae bacterium]